MTALVLPLLLADLLHLKGGRLPVEGRVEDDGKSPMVAVRRTDGSRISYPRDQVDRIERCPLPEEVYAGRRAALAEGDLRGLLELGLWAQSKGLKRESQEAFLEALKKDPGNAQALSGLGYVQVKGVWMSEEEAHAVQGDRSLHGRWLPAAAYRAAWTKEQLERAAKEKPAVLQAFRAFPGDLDPGALAEGLRGRHPAVREAAVEGVALAKAGAAVADLVDLLVSPDGEALEAAVLKALKAAGGPDALEHLFKRGFRARDEGGRLRMVRAAGALGDLRASKTLVMLSIEGASWPLRQEASRSLAVLNHRPSLQGLCAVLARGDSVQRGRAAEALQVWGTEEAVPFLIAALDQRLREGDDPGPSSRTSTDGLFEGDGEAMRTMGLLDTAPAPLTFDTLPPEAVALEKITGQSLGRDAGKWKAWWEARKR